MALTPRVLIYSPALGGHRQVYCRVFTQILHEAGCGVAVAGSFGALDAADRATLEEALRRNGPLIDRSDSPS